MRSKSYDAAELAPWDPWNGREPAAPPRAAVLHALAKSRLARCRVALVNARLALDRPGPMVPGDEDSSDELRSRLETARLLFLGAERTVADLERFLAPPGSSGGAAGEARYPPSGA